MSNTKKQQNNPPFSESVLHFMKEFDLDFHQAVKEVGNGYEKFKKRNQALIERQNNASNTAQISLIAHTTTLSILTLTVAGFLSAQFTESFNDNHKIILMSIILIEIMSLFFGLFDYIQTISFHDSWAKTYSDIDKEVDKKVQNGEIKWLSDLGDIEERYLEKQISGTDKKITLAMIMLSLLGLSLVFILFYSFFFDIPGNW